MEKAFGITLTEMEDALRDPATQFRNPLLFPAGTKEKIDGELGNFGRVFPVNECFRNSFAPFLDTLTMIKLQLVAPAELARVMFAERVLPYNDPAGQSTEAQLAAFEAWAFPRGIQMQFMRSLDAGYDYDRPDFAGFQLWDIPAARQKLFYRIFHVARPGAVSGLAVVETVPPLEIGLPESVFRPRFVWQTAGAPAGSGSGTGTAGTTVEIPRPATGGTVDATGQLPGPGKVSLGELPERTVPDYAVVLRPRPFGQTLALPAGVHVHPATLAFAEALPPPPVVLRFVADAKKYVVDGRMKDAASTAKLGEGGVLVPLDLVAKELGAGLAYDAAKGVATLETPDAKIVLTAGKSEVAVNGIGKPVSKNVKGPFPSLQRPPCWCRPASSRSTSAAASSRSKRKRQLSSNGASSPTTPRRPSRANRPRPKSEARRRGPRFVALGGSGRRRSAIWTSSSPRTAQWTSITTASSAALKAGSTVAAHGPLRRGQRLPR